MISMLGKNFKNYYARKVSEAISIKQKKPCLNTSKQEMSVFSVISFTFVFFRFLMHDPFIGQRDLAAEH